MFRKLRIVIVEDNAIIAMDLAELLMSVGHDVCAVASTENEAVGVAKLHHPDLMIVDCTLADGNGVSAMTRIQRDVDVPHIYLSGDILGITDQLPQAVVVSKPFVMTELKQATARALGDDDPDIATP